MARTGRPTKHDPAQLEKIKQLYAQGKTDKQVAAALGVSQTTINTWKKKYSDFLSTLKEHKDVADDLVAASLYSRAVGYTAVVEQVFCDKFGVIHKVETTKHFPPDVTACIFWLKNRRPKEWRERIEHEDVNAYRQNMGSDNKVDFATFCERATYPKPFEKQIEMRKFAFEECVPRMLLGARGYGKTDYMTVMGVAYDVYLNTRATSNLIITKSKSRNMAIMAEIAAALTLNGIKLDKENASCVRVAGLIGKDHSVEAVTVKTSLRGRHPKRVIMDDPVTEEDVSGATRVLVKRKYNEIMKLCSNVVVIGQPAHKYDLYAELKDSLKVLEMPHGTIKELDHDLEAQRLAGVDEASISASYHLKILSEGESPFDQVRSMDVYPEGDSVAFIDPSFEGGDYTALTILRAHMQGVAVVGFIYKKAWNHCIDEMVKEMHRFKVRRLCFETNSLGSMPLDILRAAVGDKIGVVGRKSNSNKHARIMAAGTYAQLIHISKQSHRAYVDQVIKYEYAAKNDDAPDSLASCLEWIGLIRGKM